VWRFRQRAALGRRVDQGRRQWSSLSRAEAIKVSFDFIGYTRSAEVGAESSATYTGEAAFFLQELPAYRIARALVPRHVESHLHNG
jgi:hypothetical protein